LRKRLLIAGHGSIGKRHLRIARELLPNADILVLRKQPNKDVPQWANRVTTSKSEAIAFKPQLAVIATPATLHLGTASELVRAGCNLLIEKPIAAAPHGVAKFLRDVRAAQLVCQVGYNLRFLPSLAEFRRLIQAGVVGQVLSVRCSIGQYLPDWRPGTDYRQGVSSRKELGGGVLLELSHELDYLQWILGPANWVSAWAGHLSDLEIDVEDSAFLTLGFTSPTLGRAIVATMALDFFRRDTTRTCIAMGSEGSIRWNAQTDQVELYKADSTSWETVFSQPCNIDDSYRAQFTHFLSCIDSEASPLVNGEAGLAVLNVIEAARKSILRAGQRVGIY